MLSRLPIRPDLIILAVLGGNRGMNDIELVTGSTCNQGLNADEDTRIIRRC